MKPLKYGAAPSLVVTWVEEARSNLSIAERLSLVHLLGEQLDEAAPGGAAKGPLMAHLKSEGITGEGSTEISLDPPPSNHLILWYIACLGISIQADGVGVEKLAAPGIVACATHPY